MKTLKDLQQMMREPSSKSFFKKHGLPKAITHHPAKHKALEKTKHYQNNNKDDVQSGAALGHPKTNI